VCFAASGKPNRILKQHGLQRCTHASALLRGHTLPAIDLCPTAFWVGLKTKLCEHTHKLGKQQHILGYPVAWKASVLKKRIWWIKQENNYLYLIEGGRKKHFILIYGFVPVNFCLINIATIFVIR